MFSAIDRHLKSKSYPKSIREDNIFLPCRQVLEGKARKLRSEGKGKRPHRAQSLNAEEEEILWECGQLGTFTPESLTNTVFWLLIQHFGLRGRQQIMIWKWRTFVSPRITTVLNLLLLVKVLPEHQDKDWTQDHVCKSLKCLAPEVHDAPLKFSVCSCQEDLPIWSIIAWLKFLYWQSVRFPASFPCLSFPAPFFVHCPYKGRINRAESVLTGLKPY